MLLDHEIQRIFLQFPHMKLLWDQIQVLQLPRDLLFRCKPLCNLYLGYYLRSIQPQFCKRLLVVHIFFSGPQKQPKAKTAISID